MPLTIISFTIVTKWWYVIPVDAPGTIMAGFPLIWVSDGWHTSMSLQIFLMEFTINFLIYFVFWYLLIASLNKYWRKIKAKKIITIPLFVISMLIIVLTIFIGSMPNHVYKTKRDFDIQVLDTGYKFFWQQRKRPNFSDYDVQQ